MLQLTPRQALAYSRPCYESEDCLAPRFYCWRGGTPRFTVGLTVNVELECAVFFAAVAAAHPEVDVPQWPLWHTSVCYREPRTRRPVRLADWGVTVEAYAQAVAADTLAGVGDSAGQVWERGQVALHLRRAMTVAEARGLAAQIRARRGCRAETS